MEERKIDMKCGVCVVCVCGEREKKEKASVVLQAHLLLYPYLSPISREVYDMYISTSSIT